MMRQLGALIWYCNHHYFYHALQSGHRVNLVAHLDGTKFEVQQRLQLLQRIYVKRIANEAMKKHIQL
jgi:DHA2 family multidrug resistance protein